MPFGEGGRRPLEPPEARPDPTTLEAATAAAEELFAEIERFLEGMPETLRRGSGLSWDALEGLMERALTALDGSGELFWVANRPTAPPGADYLAFHQARVGVLAMRVAGNVGYDRRRRLEIGIAGALIDVGLWQLPSTLLRRLEGLTPEEQTQYRAHPRVAADLMRRWNAPYAGLPEMVAQHHEREQGQGFPQGLTGAAIRPEAKLLGLVDTYTGLTAPASLRPGFRPHEAIREIVRSKHESFPPALIKALLSEISVFPPGTQVRLNTGEVGCVVAVNRNHPLRPRVEVYDAKGRRLATPKVIDLSEAPFIYITGPIAEGER
jgi:HD-GYP domain-containing protein (c-di-GMP phosphodiesterase class II)